MAPKNKHIIEVLRGAGLAIVLRAIGAGLAFALNVVIGRMLGAEGAGLYFLALSVVSIGAVITKLGLDNSLLRFVAAGASVQDWNRVVGVFRTGVRLATAASLGGSIALFAIAPIMAEHLFREPALTAPLRALSFGVFTFAMMMLLSECLKGLKRIRNSMLVSGVLYPAIALAVIWPLASLFGPTGAAFAYVIGTGGAAAIGYAMWRADIRKHAAPAPDFDSATLWQSARPLWMMDLLNRALLPWAPLFLLGIWGTPEEVGVFGAATRLSMIIGLFYTASITVLVPKYSELYSTGQINLLGQVARRSAMTFALGVLPVLVTLFYFRRDVMLLFGPDFGSGENVLAILLIGQMALTVMGSMGYILLVSGHEKDMRNVTILSAILMLISAVIFIPLYMSIGAAISVATGVVTMCLGNTLAVHRKLGISLIKLR